MWPFRRANKDDGSKPWKAKLDDNPLTMYYNKELKCWVEKGKEEEMKKKLAETMPPPPTAAEISGLKKSVTEPGSGGPPGAGGGGSSSSTAGGPGGAAGGDDDILGKMLRAPVRSLPGRAGGASSVKRTGSLIPTPGGTPSLIPTPGAMMPPVGAYSPAGGEGDTPILPAEGSSGGGPRVPTIAPGSVSAPAPIAPASGGPQFGRSLAAAGDTSDDDLLGLKVKKKPDSISPRLSIDDTNEQIEVAPAPTAPGATSSPSAAHVGYASATGPPLPHHHEYDSFGSRTEDAPPPPGGPSYDDYTSKINEPPTFGPEEVESSEQGAGNKSKSSSSAPSAGKDEEDADINADDQVLVHEVEEEEEEWEEEYEEETVEEASSVGNAHQHVDVRGLAPPAYGTSSQGASSSSSGSPSKASLAQHSEHPSAAAAVASKSKSKASSSKQSSHGQDVAALPLEQEALAPPPGSGKIFPNYNTADPDAGAAPPTAGTSSKGSSIGGLVRPPLTESVVAAPEEEQEEPGAALVESSGDEPQLIQSEEIDKYTVDENHEVRLRSEVERETRQVTSEREAWKPLKPGEPISISVTGLNFTAANGATNYGGAGIDGTSMLNEDSVLFSARGGLGAGAARRGAAGEQIQIGGQESSSSKQNPLDFTDLDIASSLLGTGTGGGLKAGKASSKLAAIPDDELEERVKTILENDSGVLPKLGGAVPVHHSSVYYSGPGAPSSSSTGTTGGAASNARHRNFGAGGGGMGSSSTQLGSILEMHQLPGSATIAGGASSTLAQGGLRAPPPTCDVYDDSGGAGSKALSSANLEAAGIAAAGQQHKGSTAAGAAANGRGAAGPVIGGRNLLEAFDEATRRLETLSICSDPIPEQSPVLESPEIEDGEMPLDADWPHLDDDHESASDGDSVLSEADFLGADATDPRRYLNSEDVSELQRALRKACQLLHQKDAKILELQVYTKELCTKFEKEQEEIRDLLNKNVEKERELLKQVQEQEAKFRDRLVVFQEEAKELRTQLMAGVGEEAAEGATNGSGADHEGGEKEFVLSGSSAEEDEQVPRARPPQRIASGGAADVSVIAAERSLDNPTPTSTVVKGGFPAAWKPGQLQRQSQRFRNQEEKLMDWVSKADLQEPKKLHRSVDLLNGYIDKPQLVVTILHSWVTFVGPFRRMKAFFVDFGCVEAVWETLEKYKSIASRAAAESVDHDHHHEDLSLNDDAETTQAKLRSKDQAGLTSLRIVQLCLEVLWHLSHSHEGQSRFPRQPLERLIDIGMAFAVTGNATGSAAAAAENLQHAAVSRTQQQLTQLQSALRGKIRKCLLGILTNLLQAGDFDLLQSFVVSNGGVRFLRTVFFDEEYSLNAADVLVAIPSADSTKTRDGSADYLLFQSLYLLAYPLPLRAQVLADGGGFMVETALRMKSTVGGAAATATGGITGSAGSAGNKWALWCQDLFRAVGGGGIRLGAAA